MLYFDMFVFYDWPFPHMCTLQRMQPISRLILDSVFSDCVVFYGDPVNSTHYAMLYPQNGDHIVTIDSSDVTSPCV